MCAFVKDNYHNNRNFMNQDFLNYKNVFFLFIIHFGIAVTSDYCNILSNNFIIINEKNNHRITSD